MEVTHVCLTMDKDGRLLVYKNKGRPTREETVVMNCSDAMRHELQKLKADMGYPGSTEVLLAVAIATDEMLRHVHMFPEVFFMDVTSGTNRQKRDLFVLVVRDSSGECYIGNITVIPSGQSWVFMKIYETFFFLLFGKRTISRNRLCLTDDDKAEILPLEKLMVTENHWKKSRHMLCVFHALVKAFHEKNYPLLPSVSSSGKRKLTDVGRNYCKFSHFVLDMIISVLHDNRFPECYFLSITP